ncbi:hypothetical protein D3C87_1907600 [compost metagenome]
MGWLVALSQKLLYRHWLRATGNSPPLPMMPGAAITATAVAVVLAAAPSKICASRVGTGPPLLPAPRLMVTCTAGTSLDVGVMSCGWSPAGVPVRFQ